MNSPDTSITLQGVVETPSKTISLTFINYTKIAHTERSLKVNIHCIQWNKTQNKNERHLRFRDLGIDELNRRVLGTDLDGQTQRAICRLNPTVFLVF